MSARKPARKRAKKTNRRDRPRSSPGGRAVAESPSQYAGRQSLASPASSPTTPRPRDPQRLAELGKQLLAAKFDPKLIAHAQRDIHQQTLRLSRAIDRPNFHRVGVDDLERMIRMYDERFFGGQVMLLAEAEGLSFGLSKRMTSVAGKMVTHYVRGDHDAPRKFELVLSSTLLFQTFEDQDVNRVVEVTGRRCNDRLEAMQRVAEHELVHLVEMLVWNDGNCSQARFQSIARRYFGHTDYQHNLITQRERAARKFDIRVGDHVSFVHEDRRLTGRVNRITRRATVLVKHPKGERFTDGERYVRFYVPLERLTKVG